jgi:hypothetical protein
MFKFGLRDFSITLYYVGHVLVPDEHLTYTNAFDTRV